MKIKCPHCGVETELKDLACRTQTESSCYGTVGDPLGASAGDPHHYITSVECPACMRPLWEADELDCQTQIIYADGNTYLDELAEVLADDGEVIL